MKGRAAAAILLMLTLVLTAGAAPAAGVLSFAQEVEVGGGKVTLAQLVAPDQHISPGLRRRLEKVTVMAAPRAGRQARVSGRRLRALLAQARLPRHLSVLLPAEVVVRRGTQRVTTDRIITIYTAAVEKRLGPRLARADIRVLEAGRDLILPAGRLTTRVDFPTGRLAGRVPARITFLVDGSLAAQRRVVGRVDLYDRVVVAAHALGRRHVLAPEDLKVVYTRVSDIRGSVTSRPQDLVGLRTRFPVAAGQPLELERLERVPLIRRGDVVRMVCVKGALKVIAKGRAEQTGYKGMNIRLTNLASKREVYGRVLDAGTVVVQF